MYTTFKYLIAHTILAEQLRMYKQSIPGHLSPPTRPGYKANFKSELDTCTGIVEPFKQHLQATAHPQILVLELRAPMGTCLGH